MLCVPIGRYAIVGAILAKRRHDHPTIERETAQRDGREELAHGARDYRALSERAILCGFDRVDAPSRLACHLEDWGVQARRTRGSKARQGGRAGRRLSRLTCITAQTTARSKLNLFHLDGGLNRSANRLATRALTKWDTSPPSWPISLTNRDEMN